MKRVYTFGDGKAEGNASMRNLLGGKGANLAEMNLLGMPVPPGFTITTEVCISSLRCPRINARYDGYSPQPRYERCHS